MNKAIVCVCSPNIGSIANVITYLVNSQEVSDLEIILLSDNYATAPNASYILTVADFLDRLSTGDYDGRQITIDPSASSGYHHAAEVLRRAAAVNIQRAYVRDLGTLLRGFKKSSSSTDMGVDLTCLPKPLAADVTVTCVFLGLRTYSFELIKPFDKRHPEMSMYHALSDGGFRYPCLTDPAVVAEGMRGYASKKTLRVSIVVVCLVSVSCFALLMWLNPRSSASADFALWIGIASGVIGLGTGILQLIGY